MKSAFILGALLLLSAAGSRAAAETVSMTDGTTIDAEAVEADGENLKVTTKYGQMYVPKGDLTPEMAGRYFPARPEGKLTLESKKIGENLEYFYFADGKRIGYRSMSLQGELMHAEGDLRDGIYKEYYENGGLKKEQTIINGSPNGPYKIYYPGGKLMSETYYLNGVKHGPFRLFDEMGTVISEEQFVVGRLKGAPAPLALPAPPPAALPAAEQPRPLVRQLPIRKTATALTPRFFAAVELLSVNDADKKWKENADAWSDYLIWPIGYDSTSYDMTTTMGLGARLGVSVPYRDIPDAYWGGSIGYIKGPAMEMELTAYTTLTTPGYYTGEITTSYTRILFETNKKFPLDKSSWFSIGAGFGLALAKMEETANYSGSFVTVLGAPASTTTDESWSGITWEVSPSMVFRSGTTDVEVGVRVAGFPPLKDSDVFSDFKWTSYVLYGALHF